LQIRNLLSKNRSIPIKRNYGRKQLEKDGIEKHKREKKKAWAFQDPKDDVSKISRRGSGRSIK
jgi:hypothetical protein